MLLLHRVQTSSSFPSAHVFPGGNLSEYQDGSIPPPDSPDRHRDGLAYRLAAIRETFEESGILLALRGRNKHLDPGEGAARDAARRHVHANSLSFTHWVRGLGGAPAVGNLIPFTRWVTPPGLGRRFSTQMYLYLMPLNPPPLSASGPVQPHLRRETVTEAPPTSDGGVEHTAATFEDVGTWLEKQARGEIILFPPQLYLLTLLSRFLTGPGREEAPSRGYIQGAGADVFYRDQRMALLKFLRTTPTSEGLDGQPAPGSHPTALIPWAEKVMSPRTLFIRKSDGRIVMGLDKPGPELKDSGRGGDFDRVVLVKFEEGGPRQVEVRDRASVLKEEKEAKGSEEAESKPKL